MLDPDVTKTHNFYSITFFKIDIKPIGMVGEKSTILGASLIYHKNLMVVGRCKSNEFTQTIPYVNCYNFRCYLLLLVCFGPYQEWLEVRLGMITQNFISYTISHLFLPLPSTHDSHTIFHLPTQSFPFPQSCPLSHLVDVEFSIILYPQLFTKYNLDFFVETPESVLQYTEGASMTYIVNSYQLFVLLLFKHICSYIFILHDNLYHYSPNGYMFIFLLRIIYLQDTLSFILNYLK